VSHPEQIQFVSYVRSLFPHLFTKSSVIEIGSLDINGSVRELFDECEYTGVDLAEGPNVDLVALGHETNLAENSFDVAISSECFEHNPFWREAFSEMCRLAGELVIVTAATHGRPEHGTYATTPEDSPFTVDRWDYYRNLGVEDLASLDLNQFFTEYEISYSLTTNDIYFWGLLNSASTTPTAQGLRRKGSKEQTTLPKTELTQSFPNKASESNWLVVAGELVESDWYLWNNPDVAESSIDAVTHFVHHGINENRNPNRFFSSDFYLAANPDVAQSGRPAFAHFLEFGRFEGRGSHPDVDVEWCSLNASRSNHEDYFSWIYHDCMKFGHFPFNPVNLFYKVKPLRDIHSIPDYSKYLMDLKNDLSPA
jgi:hypothetical protein